MSRPLLYLALVLFGLLAACGRSTPSNYYLLESGQPPLQADSLPARSLRVAQVNVPQYLDRNGIVSRVRGESKVIVAEFHLWAEPLSQGVRRVIRETLAPPLLAAGVNVLPEGDETRPDFTLLLDVQRLDANFDAKAVLEARWALAGADDAVLGRGVYAAEEMVHGKTYTLLVSAESRLLRRMAEHLSEKLQPLIKGR